MVKATMRSGLAIALLYSVMPSMALAEGVGTDGVFILNSLLFLMSGFLVMFMAAGFCMLEAGLVRGKNTTTQLTKNVALFSLWRRLVIIWLVII